MFAKVFSNVVLALLFLRSLSDTENHRSRFYILLYSCILVTDTFLNLYVSDKFICHF
jgi:hypothetical protein